MRLCHNQRRAAVPLVLCLEIKNIKSTSGMFSNTQHDSEWRNNDVTVLVDESRPLWVYNQQFQLPTLVQRGRKAAVNHRGLRLCWTVYTKSRKMIWTSRERPAFFRPKHRLSVTFTPRCSQWDWRGPPSVHACQRRRSGHGNLSLHCVRKHNYKTLLVIWVTLKIFRFKTGSLIYLKWTIQRAEINKIVYHMEAIWLIVFNKIKFNK